MPKETIAIDTLTEEQVIDAHAIVAASVAGEEGILRKLQKPHAELEPEWRQHLAERHEAIVRRNLEELMTNSGPQAPAS